MHDHDSTIASIPRTANPLMTFAGRLYDATRETFGIPVSLLRLLDSETYPRPTLETPRRTIDARGIVDWHEWGRESGRLRGELHGWEFSTGTLCGTHQMREDLANFDSCRIVEDWTCDIQQIDGVSASKSHLYRFASLDEMVETDSRKEIEPLTIEKLHTNLAQCESSILRHHSSYRFIRYRWDGRVFLVNSDGSHHFGAARYIAKRLGILVPLRGKLSTYSINPGAVSSLRRDFEMFVISGDPTLRAAFEEAVRSVKAAYFERDLPIPYRDRHAIFLPRTERRAMRVAQAMHAAGCFDLGVHLQTLAADAPA